VKSYTIFEQLPPVTIQGEFVARIKKVGTVHAATSMQAIVLGRRFTAYPITDPDADDLRRMGSSK
jgi:hypothetical protein